MQWPGPKERRDRLREAIRLINKLWTEDRVTFEGQFYRTKDATIYDKPKQKVPIWVAASGPLAAAMAGQIADGFICTSGKDPQLYVDLLANVKEGAEKAGRDYESIKRMIEVKVSYDRDPERAEKATHWWAALALTPEEKEGVEDPVEMERLADAATDRAHTRFIVSADPQEVADKIQPYIDLGFTELVFHFPGDDQKRAIDAFASNVLPLLR